MKKLCFITLICFTILFASCQFCQKKTAESPKKPLIQGSVIFLDTSVSMMGYFRTSNSQATIIQKFLQTEFHNILSESNLFPVYFSCFGTDIKDPEQIQGNIRNRFIFDSYRKLKKIFSGTSTNLIGVFKRKEFGIYFASIIITDGIQDSEGFDTGEILRAIKAKIDEPLYLYLIGIRSEFRGNVYPGISDRGTFEYSGDRPIYIWIATQEEEIGRNLTEKMVDKLCSFAGSSDAIKVAELTSVFPPYVSINPNLNSSDILSRPISKNGFKWKLKRTEYSEVNIPIILTTKTRQTISDVEWDINLELEPKNIGWAKLVKNNGEWLLRLTYNLIPGGFGCIFNKGKISIIAVPIPKINPKPWWRQWSTENDSLKQNASKTLYLERLELLIKGPLLKKYDIQKVLLEIKKP